MKPSPANLSPALAAVFAVALTTSALAVETLPQIAGKTFELSSGDDPIEAFAASGLSIAGTSYVMTAPDGGRFRVDRAARGRQGLVIVSRAIREVRAGRQEWQVTGVVGIAVDTSDAFTAKCKSGAPGDLAFLYYQPDKSGAAIKAAEAGFRVDMRSGRLEAAKIAAKDCQP